MKQVYVVQELKRWHCPKCDSTYTRPLREGGFQCKQCNHEYAFGVAKPRDSLTEAAAYGDVQILHNGNEVGIALQPLVAKFKHELRDFDDEDYILPVGDPVLIGLATALAAKANRGHVNLLRWDRQTRQYIKIKVMI